MQPQISNDNEPHSADPDGQRWIGNQLSLGYMKDRIVDEANAATTRRRSSGGAKKGGMKKPSSMADLMGGLPLNMKPPSGDQLNISYMKDRIEDETSFATALSLRRRGSGANKTIGAQGLGAKKPSSMADLMGGLPMNMKPPKNPSTGSLAAKNKNEGWKDEALSKALNDSQGKIIIGRSSLGLLRPASAPTVATNSSQGNQKYKILHSLPGYNLGDQLGNEDLSLIFSKESTAYAKSHLQPNDCAFILRSDGSFSYAIYEGYAKPGDDKSALTFRVDTRGHFKVLPAKQFMSRVKVPVVDLGLVGTLPGLEKYVSLCEAEDGKGEAVEGGADQQLLNNMSEEEDLEARSEAGMLPRTTIIGQLNQKSLTSGRGAEDTTGGRADNLLSQLMNSNKQMADAQNMSGGNNLMMTRATSMGQLGSQAGVVGLTSQMAGYKPKSKRKDAQSTTMDSNSILSQMVTTANNNNTQGSVNGGSNMMGIRVASMQDFRQSKLNSQGLTSVPESSSGKLGMNAHISKNNTSHQQSLVGLSMHSPNNSNNSFASRVSGASTSSLASVGRRRSSATSSTGQFGRLPSTGTISTMPRNDVTLLRITEDENRASGSSANALWDFSASGTSAASNDTSNHSNTMNGNPLLRMVERRNVASMNNLNGMMPTTSRGASMNNLSGGYGNPMSENPLLKMMEKKRNNAGGAFASNSMMSDNPLLRMMAANQKAKKDAANNQRGGAKNESSTLMKVGVDGSSTNDNPPPMATTADSTTTAMMADNPRPRGAAMRRGTVLNMNIPSQRELEIDDASLRASNNNDIAAPPDQKIVPTKTKTKFSIGDRIRKQAMPKPTMDELRMASLVSKLRPNDYAWIRRSGGYWGYSQVGAKTSSNMIFVVNENGDTKAVDLLVAGRYVRIMNDEDIPDDAVVKADGGGAATQQKMEDENKASNQQQATSEEASRIQNSKSSEDELESSERRMSAPAVSTRGSDPPEQGVSDLAAVRTAAPRRRSIAVSGMPAIINKMQRRGSTGLGLPGSRTAGLTSGTASGAPPPQSQMNDMKSTEDLGRANNLSSQMATPNKMAEATQTGPARLNANNGADDAAVGVANANSDVDTASPPAQSLQPTGVKMVECKTEDGGTKMVPMYKAGMDVYYKSNGVIVSSAKILDVHLDDLLEPYYYVRLEDGREKQTDNAHITLTKETQLDP